MPEPKRVSLHGMKLFTACLALCSASVFAQTPAGWQVMKDRKGQCQMAVPPAWVADKIMPGSVAAADRSANVVFSGKPAEVTYQQIAGMAKEMFKPVKVFEESASRTWFASAPAHGKSSWYVVLGTKPVCEAQIEFKDPSFEATARQMVESLKPVK